MVHSDKRGRRGRIALAAALVLVLPLVVACNSILGISDFSKGECAGGKCGDGGDLPDQLVIDGGSDSPTDAPIDVTGTKPVSWASFLMPNYGEGGLGDPPRPPKLTLTGDVVVDMVSNLTWRSKLLVGDFKAAQADLECKKVTPGSWRAPSRIELVTLLDYARSAPFIDSAKFADVNNARVWTTSLLRPVSPDPLAQDYWAVSFETGKVEAVKGTFNARVLCVAAK